MDSRLVIGDQNKLTPQFHITGENTQGTRKPLHVMLINISGDAFNITPGAAGAGGDGSVLDGSNTAIKATVKQYANSNPQAVVLVNVSGDAYNSGGGGSGGDGALLDGANSSVKATVLSGPTARPDVNSNPQVVQLGDDPTRQLGRVYPPVTGVQMVGGWGGQVSPSGDFPVRIAGATVPFGITGDVSTKPLAGQIWPVSQQSAWAVAGTGDFSTTPKAGQTWPVREQGIVGVQIVGGSVGAQISVAGSGDLRVKQAGGFAVSITGDSATPINIQYGGGRTFPVAEQNPIGVNVIGGSIGGNVAPSGGTLWNVKEQNVIGVQVVGGQVGGSHGVTGDVTVRPGSTPAGAYFPVSGDVSLSDGVNKSIKSTVRQYANSNPQAVALTNASGDVYSPTPKEPICKTIPFVITATGTKQLAGPYNGRVIKVVAYRLQGTSDIGCAQGHFGSAASGDALTHDWVLGVREGVVEAVSPVGGGYIFKTNLNDALVFECSAIGMRGSVTFQTGDSF